MKNLFLEEKTEDVMKHEKRGFTLAEILITLAIIGVVAAMTIPTLIAKINSIVTDNQIKVFNVKLIKGLNLTKTAGDLNDTYTSTYDFLVNGLGKNLKMAKVCDKDHIRDCIPYDKIKYEKSDKTEASLDVKEIKTAGKLKLSAPFVDVAAFVLADGTPVIASYNLKCVDDPDKADTTINGCLAGLYDVNGSRKPNKFGTVIKDDKTSYTGDLVSFNGAKLGNCSGVIGDLCIASVAPGAGQMLSAIQEIESNYTMPKYGTNQNDNWQLSNDYCDKVQGGKKLPTMAQLGQIAAALYYDQSNANMTIGATQNVYTYMKNQSTVFPILGISSTTGYFWMWSSESKHSDRASDRFFGGERTDTDNLPRNSGLLVVCIGE